MKFENRWPDMFEAGENTENEEIEDVPLYDQLLNTYGKERCHSSTPENMVYADGYSVGINGYIVVKSEEGVNIYPRNYDDGEPIGADDQDYEMIMSMVREDEAIRKARIEYAAELAKGDENLKNIIVKHFEKNGCLSDPWEYNGISFYLVDELPNYDIYMGVKDGKIYCLYLDIFDGVVYKIEEVDSVK